MKGYSILILLLSCAGCMGQTIDLTPVAADSITVVEGTDDISITCTLGAGAITTDAVCDLVLDASSTAENEYDIPAITGYSCIVLAGNTVGSVTVPLRDDIVIDTGELLVVACASNGGTMATFTINDGGNEDVMMQVVPRPTSYKVQEAATPVSTLIVGTVTITVEFQDADGNLAPLEENIGIDVIYPNEDSTDTALDTFDFTAPVDGTITFSASATGTATTTGTILINLIDDTTPENLEVFIARLTLTGTPLTITTDGRDITVQIGDNDKTELIVVHDNRTPLPRRSKKTVAAWAITDEMGLTAADLPFTYLGHNLKDFAAKIQQINTFSAVMLTLPRPNRNSKSRFNEYTFSRVQTFDGTPIERTARTFLAPTNHKQGSAPIESETGSVLVVYPNTAACTALDKTYTISVPESKYNRQLRWGFIPEEGSKSDFKILKSRGNTLTIDACDKDGLYVTFRVGRRKKGWLDYVRVIQADCPDGMVVDVPGAPPTCVDATASCKNGGIVDQALDLCWCPPGFAGTECEIATAPGTFGSNCQFEISDYIEGKQKGKCLTFSFPDVCGVTCAAGYGGADCCKPCKKGKFGANCAQTCHCVDDACDTSSGACANGCLPDYSGSNCQ